MMIAVQLTTFQWISVATIFLFACAGGYVPLFHRERARQAGGFPLGEAFTAGVFLALSLLMMMPSGLHLLGKAFPHLYFPLAGLIVGTTCLLLLALEHVVEGIRRSQGQAEDGLTTPSIPIIMTTMIAIPSFLLGAALAVSGNLAAMMILVAILTHKGTAAFALALKMVRSTLTRNQTFVAFLLFACSTPLGIVVGQDAQQYLTGHTMMVIKGVILSMASGTFLYMSTIHEMARAPMIAHCGNRKGYLVLLIGFALTALVRLLIGEAHHLG